MITNSLSIGGIKNITGKEAKLDNGLFDVTLVKQVNNINDLNKLFTNDNETYNDIINNIKNNYYIYEKGKKVYLNQKITESDLIILNANNDNYFEAHSVPSDFKIFSWNIENAGNATASACNSK